MLSASSFADVTFTGTVDPATPGEVTAGSVESVVRVGPQSFSQPGEEDPRGSIYIDGDSNFEAHRLLVGDSDLALARVGVSGPEAKLTLTSDDIPLSVGQRGSGYLDIEGGAWVEVGSLAQRTGVMTIGQSYFEQPVLGVAEVGVKGESTLLTVGQQLVVGHGVSSKLTVSEGAVVRAGGGTDYGVSLGGELTVTGDRSELQTHRLSIGSSFDQYLYGGAGSLFVRDGAIVRPYTTDYALAEIGPFGHVVLDDGTFALPIESMEGTLEGSGVFTQAVSIAPSGIVLANEGDTLSFGQDLTSFGSIATTGAVLEVQGRLEHLSSGTAGSAEFDRSYVRLLNGFGSGGEVELAESRFEVDGEGFAVGGTLIASESQIQVNTEYSSVTGRLELIGSDLLFLGEGFFRIGHGGRSAGYQGSAGVVLENGTVRGRPDSDSCCDQILYNLAVIEARAGENTVSLPVQDSGNGFLEVGQDASIAFTEEASFNGGVTVALGGSVHFSGDYYSEISNLSLTLGDSNRSQASLTAFAGLPEGYGGGVLQVSGRLLIEPEGLDDAEVDEVFKLIDADELIGGFYEYDLPELPGTLEFLPELTDTALSLRVIDSAETLPGDFSGDGVVDAADYTLWRDGLPGGSQWLDHMLWRENFGRTLAAPATASVPEPTALAAALLGVLAGCGFRRAA